MTPARHAATVVLLRNGMQGLETLLLKRSDRGMFASQWVFPGGAVEPLDRQDSDDPLTAARRAAVRECEEEAGIRLIPHSLLPVAHWVPPEGLGKRYATWFFMTEFTVASDVRVDDKEIVDHCWLAPTAALERQSQGLLALLPPTFITLSELAQRNSVSDAMAFYRQRGVFDYAPQMHPDSVKGNMTFIYRGDAEHAITPGKGHHRLKMQGSRYHYQADFEHHQADIEPATSTPDHY